MNNDIAKPLTVARQDLLTGLVDEINKSGLPAFIVVGILSDLSLSVSKLAQEQLQTDTQIYQEKLARQQAMIADKSRKKGVDMNGRRESK